MYSVPELARSLAEEPPWRGCKLHRLWGPSARNVASEHLHLAKNHVKKTHSPRTSAQIAHACRPTAVSTGYSAFPRVYIQTAATEGKQGGEKGASVLMPRTRQSLQDQGKFHENAK